MNKKDLESVPQNGIEQLALRVKMMKNLKKVSENHVDVGEFYRILILKNEDNIVYFKKMKDDTLTIGQISSDKELKSEDLVMKEIPSDWIENFLVNASGALSKFKSEIEEIAKPLDLPKKKSFITKALDYL
jgi:hypothetical protein